MPAADSILSWATSVANEWRWLAITWHLALGVTLIACLNRSRFTERLVAFALVVPVISVGVVAWISGNPFNGLMFTLLAGVLLRAAMHLPKHTTLAPASWPWAFAGAALVTFGWVYPHFLITDTPATYVYASPFGVLPCPTLSVVIGLTLVFGGLSSVSWNAALTAAGILYGWIGVFRLAVTLDVWLLGGTILLGALVITRTRDVTHHADRPAPRTAAP